MKRIFMSWSGERSEKAARALRSLLEDVLRDRVSVFMSDHLKPGVVWTQELGKELEGSDFGILCLTEDNVGSPWLLFEAGAIAKNFGAARVVPYLIDDLDLDPPLNQFQHVLADQEGTLRLVETIDGLSEKPLSIDLLRRTFAKWWPDLEQQIVRLPKSAVSRRQSDRELLEAIWQGVHTLLQANEAQRAAGISLPKAESSHLLNLRDRPDTVYTVSGNLKKEFRTLRGLGLIMNRSPIHDLPTAFKLREYFDLTDAGRQYADSLSAPT